MHFVSPVFVIPDEGPESPQRSVGVPCREWVGVGEGGDRQEANRAIDRH